MRRSVSRRSTPSRTPGCRRASAAKLGHGPKSSRIRLPSVVGPDVPGCGSRGRCRRRRSSGSRRARTARGPFFCRCPFVEGGDVAELLAVDERRGDDAPRGQLADRVREQTSLGFEKFFAIFSMLSASSVKSSSSLQQLLDLLVVAVEPLHGHEPLHDPTMRRIVFRSRRTISSMSWCWTFTATRWPSSWPRAPARATRSRSAPSRSARRAPSRLAEVLRCAPRSPRRAAAAPDPAALGARRGRPPAGSSP